MKKIHALAIAVIALILPLAFTSCDDNDLYYNTDPALYGYWELAYVNGTPVGGFQSNYFAFDADGDGTYAFYERGRLYYSDFVYWCNAYSYGDNTLNISYDDGRNSTMSYYFSRSGALVMTWLAPQGRMEYVYVRSAPF